MRDLLDDHAFDLGRIDRTKEQIPLTEIAPEARHLRELRLGLDSFGDDGDADDSSEAEDRLRQRRDLIGFADVGDERPPDRSRAGRSAADGCS